MQQLTTALRVDKLTQNTFFWAIDEVTNSITIKVRGGDSSAQCTLLKGFSGSLSQCNETPQCNPRQCNAPPQCNPPYYHSPTILRKAANDAAFLYVRGTAVLQQ